MLNNTSWDDFIEAHPGAHVLQTPAWAKLKTAFGWQAAAVRAGVSGAQVLLRPLPFGRTLAYVPRGPLGDWGAPAELPNLVTALDKVCRTFHAICLKLEPDLPDTPAASSQLQALGFRPSPHTVQPRRTLVLDLAGSEAELLGRMKQKTRYNIGLASKKGISTRPAAGAPDVDRFIELTTITSARDGFAVHAPDYYRRVYDLFHAASQCELILAEHQGELLAAVMVFALGGRAWYLYGASSDRERNRMAPYLAQWEAIRWARERGALTYDLWGVPDEPEAVLEAEFEARHDGLWGVYRFKRGFGGRLERSTGAWDRVYQPMPYRAYLAYVRARGLALG